MANKSSKSKSKFISCSIKTLHTNTQVAAAQTAIKINPANATALSMLPLMTTALDAGDKKTAEHFEQMRLAFTNRYWGPEGVDLSVGFMDNPSQAFKNKWLAHANAWRDECNANVKFRLTQTDPQVRVLREPGDGYWSYVGTDILHIDKNQQTMNLDSFTENTRESEWIRVVRHEVGHTLGAPHEHMRRSLVAKLDAQKTIAYFQRTQGWPPRVTQQQVLTPLEESSLLGSENADEDSIMCYQISGECTRDGRPIRGGANFSETDKVFAAKTYPLPTTPPVPSGSTVVTLEIAGKELVLKLNGKTIVIPVT